MMYIALFLVLLLSPAQGTGTDIIDELLYKPQFSTLVSLLTKAGLTKTLQSGKFTLFAPTDDAFSRVPSDTLTALAADPTGALADLLKYHVVSGAVLAKDIKRDTLANTLAGKKIRLNHYTHNRVS